MADIPVSKHHSIYRTRWHKGKAKRKEDFLVLDGISRSWISILGVSSTIRQEASRLFWRSQRAGLSDSATRSLDQSSLNVSHLRSVGLRLGKISGLSQPTISFPMAQLEEIFDMLRRLPHLAWIDVFVDACSLRSQFDPVWSCRDHGLDSIGRSFFFSIDKELVPSFLENPALSYEYGHYRLHILEQDPSPSDQLLSRDFSSKKERRSVLLPRKGCFVCGTNGSCKFPLWCRMVHCTYLAHRELRSTLYRIKGFEVPHDKYHEYIHGIAILCKIDPPRVSAPESSSPVFVDKTTIFELDVSDVVEQRTQTSD